MVHFGAANFSTFVYFIELFGMLSSIQPYNISFSFQDFFRIRFVKEKSTEDFIIVVSLITVWHFFFVDLAPDSFILEAVSTITN